MIIIKTFKSNLKFLSIGLIIGIIFSSFVIYVYAENDFNNNQYILQKANYKILINDIEYINNTHPILTTNGTTYVPLRSILTTIGAKINWNNDLQQAEIYFENNIINEENNMINNNYTDQNTTFNIIIENEIQYIPVKEINFKNYIIKTNSKEKIVFLEKNNSNNIKEIILNNIPYIINKNILYIEYDYYLNYIIPIIEQ